MPRGNYSFVVDSSFQPFSMQELLTPFMMYKDEYDKDESGYSDLQEKTNVWEGMVSEQNDPNTYAKFKKYADYLRTQAEDLAHNGMSVRNRRQLMGLKSRYAAEITPIEQAYAARKAQVKEQQDMLAKDPTRLFSRDARMSSLDDYMNNPALGYQQYSGALLTKQVSDAATSIAKTLADYTKGKPLDGDMKTWLQRYGLSVTEVAHAISNPQSMQSDKVLSALMNSVVESTGITEWADPATLKQAYLYASQGLWKAVGDEKVATYYPTQYRKNSKSGNDDDSVKIPNLIPEGVDSLLKIPKTPQDNPQQPVPVSQGSTRNRRYEYATGGKLFLEGGPTDGSKKEGSGNRVKISPYFGKMLDQIDDSTYKAFMVKQTGTPEYTVAQEDSVLNAYDKQLTESIEAQYLRKLFEEKYPEVEQVSPTYNARNVITALEDSQTAEDTKMWNKYKKYFYKDPETGFYRINNAGRTSYRTANPVKFANHSGFRSFAGIPIPQMGGSTRSSGTGDVTFKQWIDRRNLSLMAQNKPDEEQSQAVQNMKNRIDNGFDATLSTEYYRPFGHNQYEDILGQISFLATNGKLPNYERVKSNGSYTFKESGDKVEISKLKNKVSGMAAVYGEHGNYLSIILDDGKVVNIPFDKINPDRDKIIRSNMQRAKILTEMQELGVKVIPRGNNNVEHILHSITRALNAAGNNMVSSFSISKAKDQEVERNVYR